LRWSRLFILTSVFALGILLRLYPFMASGLPFSIDAWPLIRDSKILYINSPIAIDSDLFDGYNNYWPGAMSFSTMSSILLGVNPMLSMSYLFPFLNGLGMLTLYILMRRLGFQWSQAVTGVLIASTLYPLFFFGAGVTKETIALPIYLTIILLAMWDRDLSKGILLSIPVSISLVFTHHLTLFITVLILLSFFIYRITRLRLRQSVYTLCIFSLLLAAGFLHYILLGSRGLRLPSMRLELVISLGSYIVIYLFAATYLSYTGGGRRRDALVKGVTAFLLAMGIIYYTAVVGYSDVTPRLSTDYLLYGLPYAFIASVAVAGFSRIRRLESGLSLLYWLCILLAVSTYSIFGGDPFFTPLIPRLVNFIIIPLAALSSTAIYIIGGGRRIAPTLLLILIIVSGPSVYAAYKAYYEYDSYLGYNWRNSWGMLSTGDWIREYNPSLTVAGDTSVKYLFHDYYMFRYSHGKTYLDGGRPKSGTVFIFYWSMSRNGYNSGTFLRIPIDTARLNNVYDTIYNSLETRIYGQI